MDDTEIQSMITKLREHYRNIDDKDRRRSITFFAKYLQNINPVDDLDDKLIQYLRKRYTALLL